VRAQLVVGEITRKEFEDRRHAGVQMLFLGFVDRACFAAPEESENRIVVQFRDEGFAGWHNSLSKVPGLPFFLPETADVEKPHP
jgi:hypothetical protein